MKKNNFSNQICIKNKKASFEFELSEFFDAGIILRGTEIKSIKKGKVNISNAFCVFENNELFVRGMNISEYDHSFYDNHEPMRSRKLLLNKNELKKCKEKIEEKGLTIIPTKLFVNDRGLAKLTIAIARGKKLYDKRETIKTREETKKINQIIKKNKI